MIDLHQWRWLQMHTSLISKTSKWIRQLPESRPHTGKNMVRGKIVEPSSILQQNSNCFIMPQRMPPFASAVKGVGRRKTTKLVFVVWWAEKARSYWTKGADFGSESVLLLRATRSSFLLLCHPSSPPSPIDNFVMTQIWFLFLSRPTYFAKEE